MPYGCCLGRTHHLFTVRVQPLGGGSAQYATGTVWTQLHRGHDDEFAGNRAFTLPGSDVRRHALKPHQQGAAENRARAPTTSNYKYVMPWPDLQVIKGQLECVLPVDLANAALVLPVPPPLPPHPAWATTSSGIAVIALVCVAAVLLLAVAVLLVVRRHGGQQGINLVDAVLIEPSQVSVDEAPALTAHGETVVGFGTFR